MYHLLQNNETDSMNLTTEWQLALKQGVRDPYELLTLLQLTPADVPDTLFTPQPFPMRVPRGFVARMQLQNPQDPLLLQVLPLKAEELLVPGYSTDPLAENQANPVPGLLHKYSSRVLLTISGACAINCRYCFRREFPYTENNPGTRGWQAAVDYISKNANIHEVIFSGGDPLLAGDAQLAALAQQLAAIPHLDTLRIHTRLPIVLPQRINSTFIEWFTGSRLKPVLVTHANHPQELDAEVATAISRLKNADVTVLNQAVLLKGINDDTQTLTQLSRKLFDIGILPYYLHVLDKVVGTAHFDMAEDQALAIHAELVSLLPGYLVPKLVREEAGKSSKTQIA